MGDACNGFIHCGAGLRDAKNKRRAAEECLNFSFSIFIKRAAARADLLEVLERRERRRAAKSCM